jgi:hypothetical protein
VVYDHGPAFFEADTGVVEEYCRVGLGGVSSTEGSWLNAETPDRRAVRLDTTKRQHGDSHVRVMAHDGTRGWLVSVAPPVDEPHTGFLRYRWEPDGGQPVMLYVTRLEVGPPGALKRSARRKGGRLLPAEEHWVTYTKTDGTTFVHCREEDADRVTLPDRGGAQQRLAVG